MLKLKLLLVALSVSLLFISGCSNDNADSQLATQPAQTTQTNQTPVQEQQQSSQPEQNTPPEKTAAQHEALPEDSVVIQQPPKNTSQSTSDEEVNDSANAGVTFPAFTLNDLNGRAVNSKDLLSNRLTLINIWSTT